MSYIIKHPILLITIILWFGFVLAISFFEAWLKFRAPGVTLPIGLSIGKLIFSILNKLEWLFILILIIHHLAYPNDFSLTQKLTSSVLIIILLIQTCWLLPSLDARAELLIQGRALKPSALHFYYVAAELLKVAALVTIMITLIKKIK